MRSVFLTGCTGTIGSALVPRLLSDPATSVMLLIRARNNGDLQSRLAEMLGYWELPPGLLQAGRIGALQGDISQPDFGLASHEYATLVSRTSHIIHCAASVKLNMSLEEARATAVAPTRRVLDLGRRCAESGALRKIDLVSTVGVWGRTPGLMPERRLPEVASFHNTYEAAKSEAERVIWNEGEGLPITVHRPSMVVGESRSGRVFHFQVFYHLCEFLSGARTFGVMPDLGSTRLDTIPVDWVADVICWSSMQPEMAGRIFHLCAGPDQAMPLPLLQARVRSAWKTHGRRLPSLRHINRQLLSRLVPLFGSLAGDKARRALRALPPVLEYLAEDQGFSNSRTLQVLAAAGLSPPPVDSYLDVVLKYYLTMNAKKSAP